MPLFSSKNRDIGTHLKEQTSKVQDIKIERLTDKDICEYFLKVGFDHKGDLQSYMYSKGSTKAVEVKIDLVALAAACAGCPLPDTPLNAEIGVEVTCSSFKSNLVIVCVGPAGLKGDNRDLVATKSIVFLGMTGYKWERKLGVSASLGVKTPDIKGLPKPQGGDWSDEKPEVESGTYAELCSFDVSAEAKVEAKASIEGDRLYVSDPCPTFILRRTGKSTGTETTDEITKHLRSVLEHGDKKEVIKRDTLAFLEAHGKKLERSFIKRYITGGQVTTADLLEALEQVRPGVQDKPNKLEALERHVRGLKDYHDQNVLGPYCYVSLWGVKPQASAGLSAKATAEVKVGVGVASSGASAEVELTGPSMDVSLKFTHYRLQIATAAENRGKMPPKLVRKGAKLDLFKPDPSTSPSEVVLPSQYMIMTQDTKITYGQLDLTAIGIEGKVELGAKQTLKKGGELQKSREKTLFEGKGSSVKGEGKLGVEETGVKLKGEAKLKQALNYMFYESATAFWIPPATPGSKQGELHPVTLLKGTGYAFGQSVDVKSLNKEWQAFKSGKGSEAWYKALAGRLGV